MVRFKIGVSYIGTPYGGFTKALDSRLPSVQDRLELALRSFLLSGNEHNAGDRIGTFKNFQVSSRTDAGVHAIRNVFTVDCLRKNGIHDYTAESLVGGLNFYLSKQKKGDGDESIDEDTEFETIRQSYRNKGILRSVVVTDVKKVSNDFDARMAATARTYDYHIIAPTVSSFEHRREASKGKDGTVYSLDSLLAERFLFYQHRAWCLPFPVHARSMQEGGSYLVGEHDFSTFRNSGCQSQSPIRQIHRLDVTSRRITIANDVVSALELPRPPSFHHHAGGLSSSLENDDDFQLITVSITANSFLLRMVRNIVGALVTVGRSGRKGGEQEVHPHDVSTMLEWRQRHMLKVKPAPAEGLYLRNVHYEELDSDSK